MSAFNSVLLIEDNPGDARLVTEYLSERFGDECQVRGARTLAAGLEVLREFSVDVVLLDLALPDSCGLDTFMQVHAQAPRTPVVILTGDDNDDQAIEALHSGAEDYLAKKHADSVALIRAIRHAVQRRHAAEALRDSEARYRTIVETAEEGIVQVDVGGTIRFANARMAAMLGVSVAALQGRSLLSLTDPAHRGAVASLLAIPPGGRASVELRLLAGDGVTRWVIAAAGSISALKGEWLEVVVMLTDISGRKMAEDELLQMKKQLETRVAQRTAQLEAVNTDLEAFNYSVAHDLRNPLNGILGIAVLMQMDEAKTLTAGQRRHLQLIESSASSMNELIGGLLSLARVSRQVLAAAPLDLTAMAKAILERLALEHPERRVDWAVHAGVTALGDPALVESVLQNLLQNAWKYSERAQPAQVRFGLARSSSTQQVYFVHDNGIGFDMATAGKLFTPFSRLPSSSGFTGTGIGLATVRRIVERHGGTIWVESKPGVSTTFFFTLRGNPSSLH